MQVYGRTRLRAHSLVSLYTVLHKTISTQELVEAFDFTCYLIHSHNNYDAVIVNCVLYEYNDE